VYGKSGSGKTTLFKLILQQVQPEKGFIDIDGYDLTKIDLKKLRSEFLVINQEVALF
jgi:ATP-binding cassette subfamily B protein